MIELDNLKKQLFQSIESAVEEKQLDEIVLEYFGRKQGKLNTILRSINSLPDNQKKAVGIQANTIKTEAWRLIDTKRYHFSKHGKKEFVDLTADQSIQDLGRLHPLTLVRREVESYFNSRGYATMEGPNIESDYYNFESLNMPSEHPARDMWDTFYLKEDNIISKNQDKFILRTHISPMQVRVMEKFKPPFAVISTGRVFRHEATDARHEHTFDYTEGFLVSDNNNISLANLKTTLLELCQTIFGDKVEIRLKPSYFPFTEPSLEASVSCIFCTNHKSTTANKSTTQNQSCSVCGNSGWLEMLGAGMIHPKVFEYAGYPNGKYSGFAFGIGLSRVAMIKYNIPDIRMLYENDLRFLNQFN